MPVGEVTLPLIPVDPPMTVRDCWLVQLQGTVRTPWLSFATCLPLYALSVAHFTFNWGYYTLLTCLPQYFKHILHFDIKSVSYPRIFLSVIGLHVLVSIDRRPDSVMVNALGLRLRRSRVRLPAVPLSGNNLGQE